MPSAFSRAAWVIPARSSVNFLAIYRSFTLEYSVKFIIGFFDPGSYRLRLGDDLGPESLGQSKALGVGTSTGTPNRPENPRILGTVPLF
jgi:hypothetical protein